MIIYNALCLYFFFKLDFVYKRNNAKIILLIIFYVFSLLLFLFLYETVILQKEYMRMDIFCI